MVFVEWFYGLFGLKTKNEFVKMASIPNFLFLFFLYLFSLLGKTGKVEPHKNKGITISSANAGDFSEYNFTMKLESDLPESGTISVTFPQEQYALGLGLDYDFEVDGSDSPIVSDRTVTACIGAREAGTYFTFSIKKVRNPLKIGGTGSFKVETKLDSAIIDSTFDFGVLAFWDKKIQSLSASVEFAEGASAIAGANSSYVFNLVLAGDVPNDSKFRITFPEVYNLTYIQERAEKYNVNPCSVLEDPDTGFLPSGDWFCRYSSTYLNMIEFDGLDEFSLEKTTSLYFKVEGVFNPDYELSTDFFSIEVIKNLTNITLEFDDAIEGLSITPGPIDSVSMSSASKLYPSIQSTEWFKINFLPHNPFLSARINTPFFEVYACYISGGLTAETLEGETTCDFYGRVIELSGFEQFQRNYSLTDPLDDLIEVTFMSITTNIEVDTIPIEVYTFKDNEFEELVDESMTSIDSCVSIYTTGTSFCPISSPSHRLSP